ncbi:hypothetical protein ACFU7X_01065 [Streptomyces chartreusis]
MDTKTAVQVLTERLLQESGSGLRVALVSPGFANTAGMAGA